MTDRELLELAAKAAGVRYTIEDDEYYKTHKFFGLWLVYDEEPSEYARRYWNPLTDDGDALRLAVKLRMNIYTSHKYAVAEIVSDGYEPNIFRKENCDFETLGAATRRAIVRAAAEAGKEMK